MEKEEEGFPITALREIKILRRLKHENIANLMDIVVSKPSTPLTERKQTYLVFEYMQYDLLGLMKKKVKFSIPQIKCVARQVLLGLGYLHKNRIFH